MVDLVAMVATAATANPDLVVYSGAEGAPEGLIAALAARCTLQPFSGVPPEGASAALVFAAESPEDTSLDLPRSACPVFVSVASGQVRAEGVTAVFCFSLAEASACLETPKSVPILLLDGETPCAQARQLLVALRRIKISGYEKYLFPEADT